MNLLRMALSVMRFPPPSNPSEEGIDFAPENNWGKHLVAGYKGWWNLSAWEAVPLSSIFSMPCLLSIQSCHINDMDKQCTWSKFRITCSSSSVVDIVLVLMVPLERFLT